MTGFTDYSSRVGSIDGGAAGVASQVSGLTTVFSNLDARITALERRYS